MAFTDEQLKKRAFKRIADALFSFWEEQKDNNPRTVRVHSRIFEPLIYNEYIELNEKEKPDRTYCEHIVPCAYIRDHAFDMFWKGKNVNDVAEMIGRLLHIVYISKEEADKLNEKNKSTMPYDWKPETDSIFRRLEDANIEIVCTKNI